MSNPTTVSRFILLVVAVLSIGGCDTASPSTEGSTGEEKKAAPDKRSTKSVQESDPVNKAADVRDVTFYVAGMNEQLKIL